MVPTGTQNSDSGIRSCQGQSKGSRNAWRKGQQNAGMRLYWHGEFCWDIRNNNSLIKNLPLAWETVRLFSLFLQEKIRTFTKNRKAFSDYRLNGLLQTHFCLGLRKHNFWGTRSRNALNLDHNTTFKDLYSNFPVYSSSQHPYAICCVQWHSQPAL